MAENEVLSQQKTELLNNTELEESKKGAGRTWFLVALYFIVIFVSASGVVFTMSHFIKLLTPYKVEHYREYKEELGKVFAVICPKVEDKHFGFLKEEDVPDFFYLEEREFRNFLVCNNYSALGNRIALQSPEYIILGEHDLDDRALDSYLKASGYQTIEKTWDDKRVFKNSLEEEKAPYYIDNRDCIIFGETAKELCYQFPYCIYEAEIPFKDYPIELLLDKKVVIYLEEKYKKTHTVDVIEEKILELERNGVRVLIEPAYEARLRLFDVRMQYVNSETPLTVFATDLTPYQLQRIIILQSQKEKVGGFYGTNIKNMKSMLEMQNGLDGTIYPIIGTMNFDGIDLTFIGNKLSEYILPVYVRDFGANGMNYSNAIQNSRKIVTLFEDLMTYFEIKKESYFVNPLDANKKLNNEKDTQIYRAILDKKYDRHYSATVNGEKLKIINQEGMCAVLTDNPKADIKVEWDFVLSDYIYMLIEVICFTVFIALMIDRKRYLRKLEESQMLWRTYFEQSSDSSNETEE
ncbi:MAG: hypothetical protein MJ113_01620 [Lachnospiraceae bacterium]|nr:hypothetical protein [Lachnospiraceae bacterium]